MAYHRTSSVDLAGLGVAVDAVQERVREAARVSGRQGSDVHVVVTAKYIDAPTCAAIVEAGVTNVAENRLDSLIGKRESGIIPERVRWHFIGRLQSRQAGAVAQRVDSIHTLCSTSAASRLAALDAVPELLVQVNVDGDPAKDGLAASEVASFLDGLPERLVVSGLMTMPAFSEDPEGSRPAFATLRHLRDQLQPTFAGRHPLDCLSMGTSQDFAVAVEEGASHVRLGRILYAGGELRG